MHKMEEMLDSQAVSFCPSFNCYSSGRCEEIAAKVTDERNSPETLTDAEEDGEFTFVLGDSDLIDDEAPGKGQVLQIFPIFNRDLHVRNDLDQSDGKKKPTGLTRRLPLGKLLEDELESVPAGEYSVWRPKVVDSSSRYNKCGSTGSALKQWTLLDFLLLRRIDSEGEEDSFVRMTPKNREVKAEKQGRLKNVKAGKAKAMFRLTKCFRNGIEHVGK